MKKKKILVILPTIIIAAVLLVVVGIKAQNLPPALTLHPTNLDVSIDPGHSQTGILYLRNTTKQTVGIKTELRNFTAEGEEGGVDITAENTPFSLASWIKISPQTVTLKSGEEAKFTYSITPPLNAESGGHFGSIVFATIPTKSPAGNVGASLSQEIASLFLVTIPGPVVEKASIQSFTPKKKIYETGPITFDVRVKDEGGVHIRPAGVITVTGMFGQKNLFGFQGENVLPGAIRRMPATWSTTWLVGKYTANLALAYGSKNSQLYATTEFWAFPWKVGLVIFIGIALLFLIRKRLWKAFRIILRGK